MGPDGGEEIIAVVLDATLLVKALLSKGRRNRNSDLLGGQIGLNSAVPAEEWILQHPGAFEDHAEPVTEELVEAVTSPPACIGVPKSNEAVADMRLVRLQRQQS